MSDTDNNQCLFFDARGCGPSAVRLIDRNVREIAEDGKTVVPRAFGLCWEVTDAAGPLRFVEDGGFMLTTETATWLRAKLTAWLDAQRLAASAHICGQCQKPAPSPAATCRDHQWIGVDLDGTLAHHDTWRGLEHIGAPVPAMLARVKRWRARGVGVRILTARVSDDAQADAARRAIEAWCLEHVGEALPVTCVKDMHMTELWDDRAVTVEKNAGRPVRDPEAPTIHDALGVTSKEAARAAMAHDIPCPTCGAEDATQLGFMAAEEVDAMAVTFLKTSHHDQCADLDTIDDRDRAAVRAVLKAARLRLVYAAALTAAWIEATGFDAPESLKDPNLVRVRMGKALTIAADRAAKEQR